MKIPILTSNAKLALNSASNARVAMVSKLDVRLNRARDVLIWSLFEGGIISLTPLKKGQPREEDRYMYGTVVERYDAYESWFRSRPAPERADAINQFAV